ncbi:MAG TPA: anthranilate synthase component I family protein [bacterium]|nr:anthranilate synthase component I family protein [bacterium]
MKTQALAWNFLRGLKARPIVLLESPGKGSDKRFSLLAGEPLFLLEGRRSRAWLRCGGRRWRLGLPPERALERLGWALARRKAGPEFWPLLCALSYEAGNRFESLPGPLPEPLGLPDWWAFLPGLWAARGPKQGGWKLERGGLDPGLARALARAFGLPVAALAAARKAPLEAHRLATAWLKEDHPIPPPEPARALGRPRSNLGAAGYRDRVRRIRRHILDGDLYQANLAHQWSLRYPGDPFDLYRRLSALNPSPMAAYADLGTVQLASASPERLFRLEGRDVETRPIAGTAPRLGRPGEREALRRSAKNAAEHVMLVDLERNDLGRVCEPGSVKVSRYRGVETYSHVHHLVSRVRGRLRAGLGLADLLAAGFPGGSITGAPKIRCQEIIHGLEGQARGWYTGSLGWWEPRAGRADLNILIRSIFVKAGRAYASVGAGVVLDSDPQAEWEETLAKSAALLAALGSPR